MLGRIKEAPLQVIFCVRRWEALQCRKVENHWFNCLTHSLPINLGIIMTPTRELAMQITKECKKFTKALGLRTVCVYGGTGISEQIAELKRGAEIIVCTPGRMIDMLAANNGKFCFF